MAWKFGVCFVSHEVHLSMQELFLFIDPSMITESVFDISYFQLHDLMQFDLAQFLLHMLDHLGPTVLAAQHYFVDCHSFQYKLIF